MGITQTGVMTFVWDVVALPTFPVFCCYLLLVLLSSRLARHTRARSCKKVCVYGCIMRLGLGREGSVGCFVTHRVSAEARGFARRPPS